MKGQNIICFAKDWSEDPTSCNHVLEELAKDNRVFVAELHFNPVAKFDKRAGHGQNFPQDCRIFEGAERNGQKGCGSIPRSCCPFITIPAP